VILSVVVMPTRLAQTSNRRLDPRVEIRVEITASSKTSMLAIGLRDVKI